MQFHSLFVFLFLFFQFAKLLPAQSSGEEAVNKLVSDPQLKSASISISVADAKTGEILFAHDPHRVLSPASGLKLLTTAVALSLLGPEYKVETNLEYDGEIIDGILKGNLIIRGGGDPTLGSAYFDSEDPMKRMVDAVLKAGITRIEGNIIGDASIFDDESIPSTWIWEDMANYYGSGAFGLSIYDNKYEINFNSGAPGSLATITNVFPEIKDLNISTEVKASNINSDQAYIFGSPYSHDRIIRGDIPANRKNFRIYGSIPDPPLFVAKTLMAQLVDNQVIVDGNSFSNRSNIILSSGERKTLLTISSPPLKSWVLFTNKRSDNSYAEHMVKLLGKEIQNAGKYSAGLSVLTTWMESKGIDTNGMTLFDGSGLSRFNGISSLQMVQVLTSAMADSNIWEVYYSSLPVAGKDGSLRSVAPNTQNEFRIKSGYMKNIRSYSGYGTNPSGRSIAFSIIVNNSPVPPGVLRQKLSDLIEKLGNETY